MNNESGKPMTPIERKAEFDRLYETLPGRNIDRIRAVCDVLFCKPNTVRIWRMKATQQIIPESKLRILQRVFAKT
jgi:hypothetical protein